MSAESLKIDMIKKVYKNLISLLKIKNVMNCLRLCSVSAP
jgi:hypothetical protein